jgi:hypothetical protein
MSLRRLRRDCAALVSELDIPVPFDAHALCHRLAGSRGRPIRLIPMALPTDGPCGAWLSVADADYILYEKRTSRPHQEHIIVHEVGHLICHHQAAPVLDSGTILALLPHLAPELVARMLGRTGYSDLEEQQAEMIASLILQQGSSWSAEPDQRVAPEVAGIVDRLELSLQHRPRRRGHG